MTEIKEVLQQAQEEIRSLRRHNEILNAKVEVMDLFACVLHTTPAHRSQGESVDVVWLLQKQIDAMDDSRRPHPEPVEG